MRNQDAETGSQQDVLGHAAENPLADTVVTIGSRHQEIASAIAQLGLKNPRLIAFGGDDQRCGGHLVLLQPHRHILRPRQGIGTVFLQCDFQHGGFAGQFQKRQGIHRGAARLAGFLPGHKDV
ncbi:MAG TPA: hypothetical protein VGC16_10690, partial [Rhizomicrobium sp.]